MILGSEYPRWEARRVTVTTIEALSFCIYFGYILRTRTWRERYSGIDGLFRACHPKSTKAVGVRVILKHSIGRFV
jgi:hypothetical protein